MPPVIVAVVAAAAAASVGVALGAVTIGAAIGSVLTTTALATASYLLTPGAGGQSAPALPPTASPANAFRTEQIRQAVPPRRFVLGNVRVAGVYFFIDNINPNLYIGILLSDGVIDGIDQLYMADTPVAIDGSGDAASGSLFNGHLNVEYGTGEDSQAASVALLAAFGTLTSDFRQRGIARAVLTLDWGVDASDHSTLWGGGVTPTFKVRGVKAYDPREVGHDVDDRTTWEYTTNPALLIAFVLLSAWDIAIDEADIDFTSIEDAADDFDATLTYEGETVKYFELAGVFQSGHDVASQLDDMLRSCGAVLTYSEGKYGLAVDKARTSVWTITDDDVVALGSYTATGTTDETPTAVKARYYDADAGGQQLTTPVYEHSAVATEGYREAALSLGFCPASHSAQILAYRELQKARDGRQLQLTVSDAGVYLVPMDRVTIDFDNASFLNGEYTVVQVDLADVGCIVSLRGYTSSAYDAPSTYLEAPTVASGLEAA